MVRNTKLKIFLVALLLISVIVYFSWAIVGTYVLMGVHEIPNMDVRATNVSLIAGSDRYNEALTKYDFGLISARLDKTQIISDTKKPDSLRSIEYADYVLMVGQVTEEHAIDFPNKVFSSKFDAYKCPFEVIPADLFAFNSLKTNYRISVCLILKAIRWGSDNDELISVEYIEQPNLFAIAYLSRNQGQAMIDLAVYVSKKEVWFSFKSKASDDVASIELAYNHFIRSMSIADRTGRRDADVQ